MTHGPEAASQTGIDPESALTLQSLSRVTINPHAWEGWGEALPGVETVEIRVGSLILGEDGMPVAFGVGYDEMARTIKETGDGTFPMLGLIELYGLRGKVMHFTVDGQNVYEGAKKAVDKDEDNN